MILGGVFAIAAAGEARAPMIAATAIVSIRPNRTSLILDISTYLALDGLAATWVAAKPAAIL